MGQVGYWISVAINDSRENPMEQDDVILPHAITNVRRDRFLENLSIVPVNPARLDFVIAAPQHNARVIAPALDLIYGFLLYIVLKSRAARNHFPAEHEFLPHHDASSSQMSKKSSDS